MVRLNRAIGMTCLLLIVAGFVEAAVNDKIAHVLGK